MKIGVVGATGLVGKKLIHLLRRTELPIDELRLIASEKSRGKKIYFKKEPIQVESISEHVFDHLELVFFMATKEVALKYVPIAVKKGCIVIDNSNAFRLTEGIPLVVPEVNFHTIKKDDHIIANPNCSTIQLVVILNALNCENKIERVDVSTYQAVSGAGKEAIDELETQIKHYKKEKVEATILPVKKSAVHYPILNNAIPQIDVFGKNGYTNEELKVIYESQKILGIEFSISCTAVRVPIINGHSESITITFKDEVDINKVINRLKNSENIIVKDNIEKQIYPIAKDCQNRKEVFVGRIRKDIYNKQILHLWNVADNLLKGAAANALQIAEKCIKEKTFGW